MVSIEATAYRIVEISCITVGNNIVFDGGKVGLEEETHFIRMIERT